MRRMPETWSRWRVSRDEVSSMTTLRNEIAKLIGISLPWEVSDVTYEVLDSVQEEGYTRQLISYVSENDKVSAFFVVAGQIGE